MDFFKKWFREKKYDAKTPPSDSQGETFTCENCGKDRLLSEKKEHVVDENKKAKNVCEFC